MIDKRVQAGNEVSKHYWSGGRCGTRPPPRGPPLGNVPWSVEVVGVLWAMFPVRIYIRPPPPTPFSGHEAFFRGGGWGCIFWGPTRKVVYTPPPPFYTPPTPRRVFSGVGGLGVYKIWPRNVATFPAYVFVNDVVVLELCLCDQLLQGGWLRAGSFLRVKEPLLIWKCSNRAIWLRLRFVIRIAHSRGGRWPLKGPKKLPKMTHSNAFSANICQFFRSVWAWLFKMLPRMEDGRSN